jgi:hypothetical protein
MAEEAKQTESAKEGKAKQPAPLVPYVVLEQQALAVADGVAPAPGTSWAQVGVVEARDKPDAVKRYLAGSGSEGGTFLAFTQRSYQPLTVRTEPRAPKLIVE